METLLPRTPLRSYRERTCDHTESVNAFIPRAQRRSRYERFPPSEEIDTERVTEAPNHPPYPPPMRLALPCPNLVYLWGCVHHRTQLNALYGIP